MFALASTNAGLVSYAGLPYASPLFTRAVPAISQFSHVDYTSIPVAVPYPITYQAHAVSQQKSHVVRLAAPYAAYTTVHIKPVSSVTYSAPSIALVKAPATYTAQTRGSLHVAPLDGHELSQTSLNVASAPGTW
jgi:hypothetical protein